MGKVRTLINVFGHFTVYIVGYMTSVVTFIVDKSKLTCEVYVLFCEAHHFQIDCSVNTFIRAGGKMRKTK